jgi:hypothetical protein
VIETFSAWYCGEPRLAFDQSVALRYRSFLEGRSLSAATINLHLYAIRRLADESVERGLQSLEMAIGIRRVKGVKRLGRTISNWLLNAALHDTLRGMRGHKGTAALLSGFFFVE